jgi:hypothetical protein
MTFLEILALLIVAILGAIAIRISFTFDINKFLESRRKIKVEQLKNICPHGMMNLENKNLIFESFFASPIGTTKYFCRQCGLIVASEEDANRITEQFLKNPDHFIKRHRKFNKTAKKLKLY